MEKADITIVIPTFNGLKLLKNNLKRVLAVSSGAQVVIVDDGSTDGTSEWLRREFPQVAILTLPTNQGFARAVNAGVWSVNTPIVVLLNNDAVPESGWLDPLRASLTDKDVFAVGCLEKGEREGKRIESGRGIGAFEKGLLQHARGESARYTLWATGGSAAFNREKWVSLGGMDDLYAPFYWEDIDISYRAWKRGWKVLFESQSVVRHTHEQTIGLHYPRWKIKAASIKNQLLFMSKHVTDFDVLLGHILWMPIHLGGSLFFGNLTFVLGFFWALVYLPKAMIRRVSNGVTLKGDKEVLTRACASE